MNDGVPAHHHHHLDDGEFLSEDVPVEAPLAGLGAKTITFLGGLALIINNVTGPGMVDIPAVFITAGWFPALLLMVTLSVVAGAAAHLLCDAIRLLPGNHHYERRVELLSAVQELLPRGVYWVAFAAFLLSFTMSNIGAIVESAKTMDKLLLEISPDLGTCALIIGNPRGGAKSTHSGVRCVTRAGLEREVAKTGDDPVSPFGDDCWPISLGFLIVALIAVPLGRYNLDDSIWVQQGSCVALILIVAVWVLCFADTGLKQPVPALGDDQSIMFGTLLFNYLFVATIPSWLNEKKPSVSAPRSIWLSVIIGTAIFAGLGIFATLAYDGFTGCSDDETGQGQLDLLERILKKQSDAVTAPYCQVKVVLAARIAAYAFPPVALLSGIPVLSICIRYNLLEQNICSYKWAMFWGVLFPWIASLLLSYGDSLGNAIDWAALFSAVPLNLVMPAWLYLVASSHGGGMADADLDGAAGLEPHETASLSAPLLKGEDGGPGEDAGPGESWAYGAGGGAGARGAAPTLGFLPRPGGFTLRGAMADLKRGDWIRSEVGRKRAAARAVIVVGIAMNLAAFACKAATGG